LAPEKKVLILHSSLSQYWKKYSSNRAKKARMDSVLAAANTSTAFTALLTHNIAWNVTVLKMIGNGFYGK